MEYAISIHAPRVGSDSIIRVYAAVDVLFQSTLPVWGATQCRRGRGRFAAFQSTLPVWGATSFVTLICHRPPYFNPRSPCGERRA